jgi:hypothetical protein
MTQTYTTEDMSKARQDFEDIIITLATARKINKTRAFATGALKFFAIAAARWQAGDCNANKAILDIYSLSKANKIALKPFVDFLASECDIKIDMVTKPKVKVTVYFGAKPNFTPTLDAYLAFIAPPEKSELEKAKTTLGRLLNRYTKDELIKLIKTID